MIGSKYWLKLLWMSITLDEGPSVQISRNLEKILSFFIFFGHKTGFPARHVAPLGAHLRLGDSLEENLVFLDFL